MGYLHKYPQSKDGLILVQKLSTPNLLRRFLPHSLHHTLPLHPPRLPQNPSIQIMTQQHMEGWNLHIKSQIHHHLHLLPLILLFLIRSISVSLVSSQGRDDIIEFHRLGSHHQTHTGIQSPLFFVLPHSLRLGSEQLIIEVHPNRNRFDRKGELPRYPFQKPIDPLHILNTTLLNTELPEGSLQRLHFPLVQIGAQGLFLECFHGQGDSFGIPPLPLCALGTGGGGFHLDGCVLVVHSCVSRSVYFIIKEYFVLIYQGLYLMDLLVGCC